MANPVHFTQPGLGGVPALQIGNVLDGKYRIERQIAEGGMGIIVLATHVQLGRSVAIKCLRPNALTMDGVVQRFEREARLAAQIKSEHVVRIHDVGALAGLGPYMVMELLDGHDLRQVLDTSTVSSAQAVEFVMQACDALAEVHALDVIHRDLKPENLFLAERKARTPIVKVIDFGISKDAPKRGQTGQWMSATDVVGTPQYMSPEQLEGEADVDQRSDIWSIGVVLYELLTGVAPFRGVDLPDLCTKVLSGAPIAPSVVRPGLPAALDAVVLRCLEKDRNRRFANVAELARALAPFADAEPITALNRIELASGMRPVLGRAADPSRAAPTVVVGTRASSGIAVKLAFGAGMLAVIGGALIGAALLRRHRPEPAAPEPTATATASASAEPVADPVASSVPEVVSASAAPAASPSVPSQTQRAPRKPTPTARPRDPRAGFGERN